MLWFKIPTFAQTRVFYGHSGHDGAHAHSAHVLIEFTVLTIHFRVILLKWAVICPSIT